MSPLKILDLISLLRHSSGIKYMRTCKPRSLTSFKITQLLKRYAPEIATIIDGGANIGQFARAAHFAFPNARILSFEPIPDVANTLRTNLGDIRNWAAMNVALGEEESTSIFNRTSNDQSSSFLKPIPTNDGLLRNITQVEQIDIRIVTLDEAVKNFPLVAPVLLKLDLQGFELQALRGATRTLKLCDYVLVESVLERSYEGEPLFADIVEYLGSQGFTCVQFLNVEYGRNDRIVQVDALFQPRHVN